MIPLDREDLIGLQVSPAEKIELSRVGCCARTGKPCIFSPFDVFLHDTDVSSNIIDKIRIDSLPLNICVEFLGLYFLGNVLILSRFGEKWALV